MKKIIALVLALAMVLAVATAFAAGEGSLTVKNSEDGVKYNFYKVFDLTGQDRSDPADETFDAITYTIDSDWATFFNSTAGSGYITDTNPNSKLNPIKVDGVTKYINITESNRVDFTNAAMKYAIDNSLTPDKVVDGDDDSTVTADKLDLGYYLMVPVDMTTEKWNPLTSGSVASLTSTIPNGEIYVKATKPTVTKTDDTVSADIGQTVNYSLKGSVPNTSGTAEFIYILSDTMTDGLTFNKDVAIKIGSTEIDSTTAATWITYPDNVNGFVVDIPVTEYQDKKGQVIELTYSAVVNENAISQTEWNEAKVTYGRTPGKLQESIPVYEEVYSAKIIINKYFEDKVAPEKKLKDAVFALMKIDATEGAMFYKYTEVTDGDDHVDWVAVANAPESATATVTDAMVAALKTAATAGTITTKTTDKDGAASFDGLKDGTYYLIEMEAPAGYNRLDAPKSVIVAGNNVDSYPTHYENTAYADGLTNHDTPNDEIVDVENKTGTVLPSTGGIGTTIFYIVGGLLLVGAAVILVARKKSND